MQTKQQINTSYQHTIIFFAKFKSLKLEEIEDLKAVKRIWNNSESLFSNLNKLKVRLFELDKAIIYFNWILQTSINKLNNYV